MVVLRMINTSTAVVVFPYIRGTFGISLIGHANIFMT